MPGQPFPRQASYVGGGNISNVGIQTLTIAIISRSFPQTQAFNLIIRSFKSIQHCERARAKMRPAVSTTDNRDAALIKPNMANAGVAQR